jgi:hypothetical protein
VADDFERMIRRAAAGGGDRGRKRRRSGPPDRPPFIAHPCTAWDDAHVRKHLAACERGRDPTTGEWAIDHHDSAQVWAWIWETTAKSQPDGSIDFGPWPVREVEVP